MTAKRALGVPTKSYKLDGLWTLNGCHCLAAPIVGNLFGGETLTTVTVTFTVTFTVTVTVTVTANRHEG